MIQNSQNEIAKKFHRRPLRPLKFIKFVPQEKCRHFQFQTISEECKCKFCRFSCDIIHDIFVIPNFLNKMIKIFHGHLLRP